LVPGKLTLQKQEYTDFRERNKEIRDFNSVVTLFKSLVLVILDI